MVKGSKQVPPDDSYFMGRLFIEASACRDPEIQKAAMLVDSKRDIISVGFNCLLSDYSSTGSWSERDFAMYTAEDMALDRAIQRKGFNTLEFIGAIFYVLNPPTHSSLTRCYAIGVKKVMYLLIDEQCIDQQDWLRAQHFAKEKKLELKVFDGNLNWIKDRIMKYEYLF